MLRTVAYLLVAVAVFAAAQTPRRLLGGRRGVDAQYEHEESHAESSHNAEEQHEEASSNSFDEYESGPHGTSRKSGSHQASKSDGSATSSHNEESSVATKNFIRGRGLQPGRYEESKFESKSDESASSSHNNEESSTATKMFIQGRGSNPGRYGESKFESKSDESASSSHNEESKTASKRFIKGQVLKPAYAQISTRCPRGWVEYKPAGSCYLKMTEQPKTHYAAEEQCRRYGAHLTSITSQGEYSFLCKLMNNERFHLGMRQEARGPIKYKWLDGSRVTVTYWERERGWTEPNHHVGDFPYCVTLWPVFGPMKMVDDACTSIPALPYVCKKPFTS